MTGRCRRETDAHCSLNSLQLHQFCYATLMYLVFHDAICELCCTLFPRQLQLNYSWKKKNITLQGKDTLQLNRKCCTSSSVLRDPETLSNAQNANGIKPEVAKATNCHQDPRTFAQSQVRDLPSAASPTAWCSPEPRLEPAQARGTEANPQQSHHSRFSPLLPSSAAPSCPRERQAGRKTSPRRAQLANEEGNITGFAAGCEKQQTGWLR